MIPLNRPVINNSNSVLSVDDFVSEQYFNLHYAVTFSARHGLWHIYQKIFETYGRKTVAVSPLTCVEALHPIIDSGHEIHFVDIDPETLNMNESRIENGIDIIQAIHFGGNPQNMNVIRGKGSWLIVEDCAQAFGSIFENKNVGQFGDFAAFSMMKNFYSLGGGLLLSKRKEYVQDISGNSFGIIPTFYRWLKRYLEKRCGQHDYLNTKLLVYMLGLKPENVKVKLTSSNINRIIEKSIERQLAISGPIINNRILVAEKIRGLINGENLIPQKITNGSDSNFLRLFFVLRSGSTIEVVNKLRKYGIGANHLTQSFDHPYQERLDRNKGLKKYIIKGKLPNYFELHDKIISIPVSPSLSNEEISRIADCANEI